MDRQVLDDIFCFTEILKIYFSFQIERLNYRITQYENEINAYYKMRLSPISRTNTISFTDYGILQNSRRIKLVNEIKEDLINEIERIQYICDKYYYEKGSMASSFMEEKFFQHKILLNQIIDKLLPE